MMDKVSKDVLNDLLEITGQPAISLFLPTFRTGREIEQGPIRLKNLLRTVARQLEDSGMRSRDVEDLLAPAIELLDEREFWEHQSDGLALFLTVDKFERLRVPIHFDEHVIVARHFHLRPMIPPFSNDSRFCLLAFSQNHLRLFDATRFSMDELAIEGIPTSLEDAMKYEDPEKQLQFRTQAPPQHGQRSAQFHGHGVGTDDSKDEILRYCHMIDNGLPKLLPDRSRPLVIAAVDYLQAIYREANSYPHLLDGGVEGNPDQVQKDELHRKAWQVARPHFDRIRKRAVGQFSQMRENNRASTDLDEIVLAAQEGRIDTLFLNPKHEIWGRVDPENYRVQRHGEQQPDDVELLDYAARHTYRNHGTVFEMEVAEMPEQAAAAALYRYEIKQPPTTDGSKK